MSKPETPSPAAWRWTRHSGLWKVFWSTLPRIAESGVGARQNVVADASATGFACSALHCVAANVNISVRRWTYLIRQLRLWALMIFGLQATDVLKIITFVSQSAMTVVLKSSDRLFFMYVFLIMYINI